ncbi:hypothetical protein DOT_3295, partial [Desulfosporosinus sp. OT]
MKKVNSSLLAKELIDVQIIIVSGGWMAWIEVNIEKWYHYNEIGC